MADHRKSFATAVIGRYEGLAEHAAYKSAAPVSDSFHVGHPDFEYLRLGQTAHCEMASAFIDLSEFTRRTFWDPPGDVARLARAFLDQVARIVQDRGGHVLGLRGDGLLAGFGGVEGDGRAKVACALAACAFALDATRNALNNLLDMRGIEPVLVKAGVDFGRADFTRTGTEEGSEVNVVGFTTNFAAKCEKYAKAWEVVIGQGAAQHVTAGDLLTEHDQSPKSYSRGDDRRYYRFYKFGWPAIAVEAAEMPELRGATCSDIRMEGGTP